MRLFTRRQNKGLGQTAGGGNGGSFASHVRSASSPPAPHFPDAARAEAVELAGGDFEWLRRSHYVETVCSIAQQNPDDFRARYGDVHPAGQRQAIEEEYARNSGGRLAYAEVAEQFDDRGRYGSPEDRLAYVLPDERQQRHVVQAYIDSALWASNLESNHNGDYDDGISSEDISDELRAEMSADLASFMLQNRAVVRDYLASERLPGSRNDRIGQLANDFWLARNGHRYGFQSRGLGQLGDHLTAAPQPYGSVNLYVGDDGRVRRR